MAYIHIEFGRHKRGDEDFDRFIETIKGIMEASKGGKEVGTKDLVQMMMLNQPDKLYKTGCPFCGKAASTSGMPGHIRCKHPEEYSTFGWDAIKKNMYGGKPKNPDHK